MYISLKHLNTALWNLPAFVMAVLFIIFSNTYQHILQPSKCCHCIDFMKKSIH